MCGIYAKIVRARTNAEWFSHASCHVVALLIYVLAVQVWFPKDSIW